MNIDAIMNPQTPTKSQVSLAFQVTTAIGEAIRELGEVPSGVLYAHLISKVDLHTFQVIIRTLKNAGLIEVRGDLLVWCGSFKGEAAA